MSAISNMTILNTFTPAQLASIGKQWVMSQLGMSTAPTITKTTTKRSPMKRTRTAKGSTATTLATFFANNPGGFTLQEIATKTGIKPNILGRLLKSKNTPYRQVGENWLMNKSGSVDRRLTQAKAA